MLDRREFLKFAGAASLTAIAGGTLIGCSSENSEEEIIETNSNAEGKESVPSDTDWTATGNKKIFEPETHLIYAIDIIGKTRHYGEINIPTGYSLVSNEEYSDYRVRYVYINSVPVEALEYQRKSGRTAYPFAGTPLDLEKAEEVPKIYSKTM